MRLDFLLAGISGIIAGLYMYKTGWINRYQLPVPPKAGILFVFLGLIFLFAGIFSPSKKSPKIYICLDCNEKFKAEHVKIPVCPKCDGKLVEYKEPIDNGTGRPVS